LLGGMAGQGPIDSCAGIAQNAKAKVLPADIIWMVDTSGSMDEEAGFVQNKLNAFAQGILKLGIDVRVVLVAAAYGCPVPFPQFCPAPIPYAGICLAPPLGSGGCPNDTNPPVYTHVTDEVGSTDGLSILKNSYPKWKSFLRAESTKTIIVVTDDDATSAPYDPSTFGDGEKGAAKKFIDDFSALDPARLKGWKLSGIFSFTSCPTAANVGKVWGELVSQTGGNKGDLCTQDFQPIFNDLAKAIVAGSKLDCQWKIPAPPEGQVFDQNKVNVAFTSGAGAKEDIYFVPGEAACDPAKGGWYYDNQLTPGAVIACPASCQHIQGDQEGKIAVLFGCATQQLDPK
jgi:hypothetical protein